MLIGLYILYVRSVLFALNFRSLAWVEILNSHAHFDMESFSFGGGAENKGGVLDWISQTNWN